MKTNQPADYYNKLYLESRTPLGFFHRNRIDTILKYVPKNSSVLDIGCSAGLLGILLKREGCTTTGVDNRPECVAYAQKHSFGTYICADIVSLDLKRNYDIVVCSDVIEHFVESDRKKVFKAIDNHLKVGGTLIITTPGPFEHTIEPIWKIVRRIFYPNVVFDDEGVHELVTIEEIQKSLGRNYKTIHAGVAGLGMVSMIVFEKEMLSFP